VVSNKLPRQVSTPVVSSEFTDPEGDARHPTIRIEPGLVTLEPGDRAVVGVTATITDDLSPGVAYRGRLTVPDLSDDSVPVLIRRVADATPAAASASPAAPSPRRRQGTRHRKRA
jgi:hypothetical protein